MKLTAQMKVGDLVRYNTEYTSDPIPPVGIVVCVHENIWAPIKIHWSDHFNPGKGTRREWYSEEELEIINESR